MIYPVPPSLAPWLTTEEGRVLHVYRDSLGYPTIGVGHRLLSGESFPNGIDDAKCDALLDHDIQPSLESIARNCPGVEFSEAETVALVSWLHNCGAHALDTSRIRTAINGGRFDDVPHLLEAWCKGTVDGKLVEIAYLLARRKREGALWLAGMAPAAIPPPDHDVLNDAEQEHLDGMLSAAAWDAAAPETTRNA